VKGILPISYESEDFQNFSFASHALQGTLKCTVPQKIVDHHTNIFLCCGTGFIEFIYIAFPVEKIQLNLFLFLDQKLQIYLSLVFLKRCQSYRRSLQPSKENIEHLKK
jgi:hypothetical protein